MIIKYYTIAEEDPVEHWRIDIPAYIPDVSLLLRIVYIFSHKSFPLCLDGDTHADAHTRTHACAVPVA